MSVWEDGFGFINIRQSKAQIVQHGPPGIAETAAHQIYRSVQAIIPLVAASHQSLPQRVSFPQHCRQSLCPGLPGRTIVTTACRQALALSVISSRCCPTSQGSGSHDHVLNSESFFRLLLCRLQSEQGSCLKLWMEV